MDEYFKNLKQRQEIMLGGLAIIGIIPNLRLLKSSKFKNTH